MAHTFSVTKNRLGYSFPANEDTFIINVDPVETKTEMGKSISMGFPALAVSPWVKEREDFANLVARLLAEHYAKEDKINHQGAAG